MQKRDRNGKWGPVTYSCAPGNDGGRVDFKVRGRKKDVDQVQNMVVREFELRGFADKYGVRTNRHLLCALQVSCTALHQHQILYHRLVAFLLSHGVGTRTPENYEAFSSRYRTADEHIDHGQGRWWVIRREYLIPTEGTENRRLAHSRKRPPQACQQRQ